MSSFKINQNIYFVPSLQLDEYMKVGINRVNSGCGWGEVALRSNTAYLFYFTQNLVVASLRLDFYPNYAEIYDVCTLPSYRGKGYMKILLQKLDLLDSQYKTLWLGVRTDAEDRDLIISLYAKAGFQLEKYRNETYSHVPIDFTFFGMTKRGVDKTKTRSMYNMLDDLQENVVVKIAYETLRKIYYTFSLGKTIEFAGAFNIKNFQKEITLEYSDNVISADPNTPYNVIIPISSFNWHTHPNVCYRKFNCSLGWPSGLDMSYIFSQYLNGLLQHFVFTEEGVYIIYLTYSAMKFMHMISMNQEWIQYLTQAVQDRFSSVEDYRKSPIFLTKFIEVANTYDVEQYIRPLNEKDKTKQVVQEALSYFEKTSGQSSKFPLLTVRFYPGTTFYTEGYISSPFSFLPSPSHNSYRSTDTESIIDSNGSLRNMSLEEDF